MTPLIRIALLFTVAHLTACASQPHREAHDPLEGFNRSIYAFNDALDKAILKPVAKGYDKIMPKPVDRGIDNVLSNLGDVTIIINDLLQLKGTQTASDIVRLLLNSTVGLAGLFDVATPLGLSKHNEDFGQTLGRWGVSTGPYLVLPFFGPSNLRDGFGRIPDGLVTRAELDALGMEDIEEYLAYIALSAINTRQSLLGADDLLQSSGADPYLFLRESYLQRRAQLVRDGRADQQADTLSEDEEDALFGEDDF